MNTPLHSAAPWSIGDPLHPMCADCHIFYDVVDAHGAVTGLMANKPDQEGSQAERDQKLMLDAPQLLAELIVTVHRLKVLEEFARKHGNGNTARLAVEIAAHINDTIAPHVKREQPEGNG